MNNEHKFTKEFQDSLNQLKEEVNSLTNQQELSSLKVKSLEADSEKTAASLTQFNSEIDTFMKVHKYSAQDVLYKIIHDESIPVKKIR
ncbi:hypothetical protein [Jeotgalicoccus sp. WY2]|uniref:hypothetical protein n=1 Tax=Jeotgalicoccus sp. WY2 TaxID=2708346 RepID=UPI001BD67479|nr:hypothetical protein [Jeotgalicoccus sp. WY2]